MTPIENERCLNFFNQVISRDKSTCNMSEEEDTPGSCQCLDVPLVKWLLVSFSKCIPLKLHQPCCTELAEVQCLQDDSHLSFLFLCVPVLIFLIYSYSLFFFFHMNGQRGCPAGREQNRVCIQKYVTGVVTAINGWYRRELQISKTSGYLSGEKHVKKNVKPCT